MRVPDGSWANAENRLISSTRRLVVLVIDVDGAEIELARRIWLLASPRGLDVLYLSLVKDLSEEPAARRRLTTLAALTRDARTHVETAVSLDHDWLLAVRGILHPQDVIICASEQMASTRGLRRQPLDQALASALQTPVYLMSGLDQATPRPQAAKAARRALSLLPFLIVVGFFMLQLQIAQLPHGWSYYVLMCLSVLAEAGLIMLCVRLGD